MDKQLLFKKGVQLAERFCKKNLLPMPAVRDATADTRKVNSCAYYRKHTGIVIYLDRCAHPNPLYSWPSFISDRTPYGVIAHELGHHVDGLFTPALSARMLKGEKPLTSYCPNDEEYFAEMFRLFLTNPKLLQLVRPTAHRFISGWCSAVVRTTWDVTLERHGPVPARIYDRAVAKVVGGRS